MANPGTPRAVHEIIAVYGDARLAQGVATQLEGLGIDKVAIEIGDADARVMSMKAEMRQEIDDTIVGAGNVGPFTKGMTKGIIRQTIAWTVGLTLVGTVLALFDWPGSNLEFGSRVIIAALVGAATGATIGFVWGGARGAASETSMYALAAERGVTLAASIPDTVAAEAVRIMRSAQPIRLDLGTLEGTPLATIETEQDANR